MIVRKRISLHDFALAHFAAEIALKPNFVHSARVLCARDLIAYIPVHTSPGVKSTGTLRQHGVPQQKHEPNVSLPSPLVVPSFARASFHLFVILRTAFENAKFHASLAEALSHNRV